MDIDTTNNEIETTTETATTADLGNIFQQLSFREEQIAEAEDAYEQQLRTLAAQAGSKTFCHEGQYYQVVERHIKAKGRKALFLKRLPGPPSSWLRGMPKGGWPTMVAKREAATTEAATDTQQDLLLDSPRADADVVVV